jgi:hypothetical protein
VRPYFSSERWISVRAQALPAVPDDPHPMRTVNCSAHSARIYLKACLGGLQDFPARSVLRKLLDSRGVLGQILLGIIVDFLTWPTTANLFWTA